MNKAEQLAYDEHINAIMIQNDVLSTAAMEAARRGLPKVVWKRSRRMPEG